jgi:hypothetical protein
MYIHTHIYMYICIHVGSTIVWAQVNSQPLEPHLQLFLLLAVGWGLMFLPEWAQTSVPNL